MTTTTPTYTVGDRVVVPSAWSDPDMASKTGGPGTVSRVVGDVAYVVLDCDRDAMVAGTSEAPFAGVVPVFLSLLKPEPTV